MTLPQSVVIRADASHRIGGGHVMRCLTLADALAEWGVAVTFVCAELVESVRGRIEGSAHRLIQIAATDPGASQADWDVAQMGPVLQQADADETLAAIGPGGRPLVIVDHYRLDQVWEQAVRPRASAIVAVDDLANRAHDCDVLLDQSLGRRADDYRSLVPGSCTLLLGPRYALLRPQFEEQRQNVLDRWLREEEDRRLFIFFGTADLVGITGELVAALAASDEPSATDVVISPSAPSFPLLVQLAEQDPRISLHIDVVDMAALMARADLAIGAAGTASWERCCLGLPTVTLALADNQRLNATQLSQAGACVLASNAVDAANRAQALLAAPDELARMAAAAMAIVDGRGTKRAVDHLLCPRADSGPVALTLREANAADMADIWLWRNDPIARAVSGDGRAISWQDHVRWWGRSAGSEETILYIGAIREQSVGMVRFDAVPSDHIAPLWRVSINLAPASRGRGVGSTLLASACEMLRQHKGPVLFLANISPDNRASIQVFERTGFVPAHSSDATLLTYMLPADRPVRGGRI